jgi:hypothetical protein
MATFHSYNGRRIRKKHGPRREITLGLQYLLRLFSECILHKENEENILYELTVKISIYCLFDLNANILKNTLIILLCYCISMI